MNNSNNINEDNNNEKKVLQKKRKPNYSLEDVINIYCCTHKIKDNEIQEKIKTINYEKPSELIKIAYDKDKGEIFPLSRHLKPAHLKNEINVDEDKDEEKEENKKEENEIPIKDEIDSCFNCGWQFLKGMSLQEKNTHINLCFEGKGEDNKKELISTYTELENLQKNIGERQNADNNNNNNQNSDQNDSDEKSNENNNEEEDEKDSDEDKEGRRNKRYKDENDDDLML